ncbi:UNVERIFIED_CONTAM: hypothetical protein GTU68_014414 [Idotea baltica]|nr:hypothetical protein [Idotea baltica]
MNLNIVEAEQLVKGIGAGLNGKSIPENLKVIVAPPHVYLNSVNTFIPDCSANDSGAFTGETSATMLKNVGCEYTLIGHSERRSYHNESDELLLEKLRKARAQGLKVIFCCGETLEERNAEKHFEVIERQLKVFFYEFDNLDDLIVAYEPVWAIGTGVTASPEQAQEVHAFIRKLFSYQFGDKAEKLTILYGGSCKPANATELFAQPDIDGGLIGGAALKPESFIGIIDAMINQINA